MTIGDVLDRWATVLEASPYAFARSVEPFSFDLLPQQTLDHAYSLGAELERIDGGFAYTQTEQHRVVLHLAEKIQRDPDTAWRALVNGCSSLAGTFARDSDADGTFTADVTAWEVRPPGADDDHLVARLIATVDLERAL